MAPPLTMRIWHIGGMNQREIVDGVNNTVRVMAHQHREMGHDAHHFTGLPPDDAPLPDLAQLYSVFAPDLVRLARRMRQAGVPYAIKPAGGLSTNVLSRGRMKKWAFSLLFERPRFRAAAALIAGTPREEAEIRSFVPGYAGIVRQIGNPVETAVFEGISWNGASSRKVVYFGRFDVHHKGLDVLFEIARLAPDIRFELYGEEVRRTRNEWRRLAAAPPPNLTVNAPLFGKDKARVMAGAAVYIQPSRWEGIARSVCEAMHVGLPCAISARTGLFGAVEPSGAPFPLRLEPAEDARLLREALTNPAELEKRSQLGRTWALRHFDPLQVAERYLDLYREVLKSKQRGKSP